MEALRKAIPEPISFEQLDFNLGERWIPMSVYEEFAGYLFETKARIHYTESIDEFSVDFETTNANITDRYYVKGEKKRLLRKRPAETCAAQHGARHNQDRAG